MSDNYEIGYKKPPKKNQFKPGQSGNPSGKKAKKRSPKNISEALIAELTKIVPVTVDGKIEKSPLFQVFVKQWINQSIKGSGREKSHFMNHLDKLGVIDLIQNDADDSVNGPVYSEEDKRLISILRREFGREDPSAD